MQKLVSTFRSKATAAKVAVFSAIALASAGSMAQESGLPTWASGMGATFETYVTDAAAMVGPVIALSVGSVIVIKLIKRFSNKI